MKTTISFDAAFAAIGMPNHSLSDSETHMAQMHVHLRHRVDDFLEVKLGSYLTNTRAVGIGYHTKRSAVDQSAWGAELCMVKDIEELKSKIKKLRFGEMHIFGHSHIPVIDSRPAEEAALRIPKLPYILNTEQRGVEVGSALARVLFGIQLARRIKGLIC